MLAVAGFLVLCGTSSGAWLATASGSASARAGTLAGNKPTLTKTGVATLSVVVSWAPTPGAAGYTISRTGGVGTIGAGCSGVIAGTTCTDSPVLPLQTYTYTVTPVAGSWTGTASAGASIST